MQRLVSKRGKLIGTFKTMTDKKNDLPIKRGPWLRKTHDVVYENPWIKVTHDEVTTPGGTDGVYGLVHFKNRAIAIIPIDEQGNTRLVGQYRYALDHFSWELPMGGGARNKDSLEAAKRELKEETGLSGGNWHQLIEKLYISNSITDEEASVFVATDLQQGEQELEASEADMQVKNLPLEEAIQMALDGRVTDVISVAGLLAVKEYLSNNS